MHPEQLVLGGDSGFSVELTNYGASIMSIRMPTNSGVTNVVLGYPLAGDYVNEPYYMGATCGRYAGRIDRGTFELLGERISLQGNDGTEKPVLHGGPRGLHTKYWAVSRKDDTQSVTFGVQSPHGDMGFPGCLDVEVTYRIEKESRLCIEYHASCDRPTVLNLANHAYFNLNGNNGSVEDDVISIDADQMTVLGEDGVPTGAIESVADSPFDLRTPASLRDYLSRLRAANDSMTGFDQNYVLNKGAGRFGLAATLFAPRSGIALDVLTTQPGLQFYTGENLAAPFSSCAGLCLEAQNFPDAPNHPTFPSSVLMPGESYRQRTVYAFREVDARELQGSGDSRRERL